MDAVLNMLALTTSIESMKTDNPSAYLTGLTTAYDASVVLSSEDSELSRCLEDLLTLSNENITLSMEAFEKKRSTLIDRLLTEFIARLEAITSANTWSDTFTGFKALSKKSNTLIKTLRNYSSEIKNGTRVAKKDPVLSDSVKEELGLYSTAYSKFSWNDYNNIISEFFDQLNDGLVLDSLERVLDNLVVSKSNEDLIPKDKRSIDYVRQFKNIDIDKQLYKDTRVLTLSSPVGVSLRLVQVIQDPTNDNGESPTVFDGLDFYDHTIHVNNRRYSNLLVNTVNTKDISTHLDYLIKTHSKTTKTVSNKALKGFFKRFIKFIRSYLVTGVFTVLVSILAIKRALRVTMLFTNYIKSLNTIAVQHYSAYIRTLDLTKKLIEETTELKK